MLPLIDSINNISTMTSGELISNTVVTQGQNMGWLLRRSSVATVIRPSISLNKMFVPKGEYFIIILTKNKACAIIKV